MNFRSSFNAARWNPFSEQRLPLDCGAFCAVAGIAGLRRGEAAGLGFRHDDSSEQPLGRLLIDTLMPPTAAT